MNSPKRRTESQWLIIVNDHISSGLTIKKFCEQNDIKYGSFVKWKQKFNRTRVTPNASASLIKLLPPENKKIPTGDLARITYSSPNGRTLRWDTSVDANYITTLLRELR